MSYSCRVNQNDFADKDVSLSGFYGDMSCLVLNFAVEMGRKMARLIK
jgi:hypothetical protein